MRVGYLFEDGRGERGTVRPNQAGKIGTILFGQFFFQKILSIKIALFMFKRIFVKFILFPNIFLFLASANMALQCSLYLGYISTTTTCLYGTNA